ncbi:unnamed protein product [Pseudo-nitzschia multistriata]|uniref:Tr-type G domain-containing protein n=1 Tax=Pseudo-nitzschia multistriata TaxID=183589 RepID=A0A448ZFS1_9STRA|nr:unnamed protein product [Pseudo-nitzschia multistriata]
MKGANATHEEISEDNKKLRSSDVVEEKTFDIQVDYQICEMRPDTNLILIDIPGINEAEASKKYKDYVESNWDTFDCVVVVMDAIKGVNTEEQVELLKFVQQNNQNTKDIPTIILGNKIDDPDDEDAIALMHETHTKTMEIFGHVDSKYMPHERKTKDNENNYFGSNETDTAFIPISAKNAFTYRKAGRIDTDHLKDAKHRDLLNKIGNDELGRKWSKMDMDKKVEAVTEILRDPAELDERLADTNFNTFLAVLSSFVGSDERQQDILRKQTELELARISHGVLGEKAIAASILEVFKRMKPIGWVDTGILHTAFWGAFENFKCGALIDAFETDVSPKAFGRAFTELEKYHDVASKLGWTKESERAIFEMKKMLRSQLVLLLQKVKNWSFHSFCMEAGVRLHSDWGEHGCGLCSGYGCNTVYRYPQSSSRYAQSSSTERSYGVCRRSKFASWPDTLTIPSATTWANLSPQDWITILASLSLVWNQSWFIEDFGHEKLELEAALLRYRSFFYSSPVGTLSSDKFTGNQDDDTALNEFILSHSYKDAIINIYGTKKSKKSESQSKNRFDLLLSDVIDTNGTDNAAITKVRMPMSLADPSHWGNLAWKYIKFCNKQEDMIDSREKKKPRLL